MKDLMVSRLNDIYGDLLTERQSSILRHYYDDDLSYGEMSEIYGITRQSVGQILKNAQQQLENMEQKIGVNKILEALQQLRQDTQDQTIKARLDTIIAIITK